MNGFQDCGEGDHRKYEVRFVAGLLLCLMGFATVTGIRADAADSEPAAESAAESDAGTAAERFAASHQEWGDLSTRLDDVVSEFKSADADRRTELRKEHQQLVADADTLLARLRVDGIAAYAEAPNDDQQVVELLVSLLASDVRSDRYDEAAEIAELLTENECDDKRIHQLAGTAAYGLDDFAAAKKHLAKAKELGALSGAGQILNNDCASVLTLWKTESEKRQQEAEQDDLPRVRLTTNKGDLVIELYENEAPQTVGNFVRLVEDGFYDGLTFHRVLPGFMAQGGCPDGTGGGGPGYEIYCECLQPTHRKHFRGTLSMAHAGPNTGGSQFFLTFRRTPHLDSRHTVFGRVVEGLDILPQLQRRDPTAAGRKPTPDKIVSATVVRKRKHEYKPSKVK